MHELEQQSRSCTLDWCSGAFFGMCVWAAADSQGLGERCGSGEMPETNGDQLQQRPGGTNSRAAPRARWAGGGDRVRTWDTVEGRRQALGPFADQSVFC